MTELTTAEMESELSRELVLSNGIALANRIAKAAMSEHLASRHGAPSRQLIEAYRQFAASGAGLLISGNVMVDGSAMEAHRNVVIEDDRFLPELRDWRRSQQAPTPSSSFSCRTPADRQCVACRWPAGDKRWFPPPRRHWLSRVWCRLFKPPRPLAEPEILAVIERFATAARVAATAGFGGVQLHAAHGYLLNQFLSPLVNRREDRGGLIGEPHAAAAGGRACGACGQRPRPSWWRSS